MMRQENRHEKTIHGWTYMILYWTIWIPVRIVAFVKRFSSDFSIDENDHSIRPPTGNWYVIDGKDHVFLQMRDFINNHPRLTPLRLEGRTFPWYCEPAVRAWIYHNCKRIENKRWLEETANFVEQ